MRRGAGRVSEGGVKGGRVNVTERGETKALPPDHFPRLFYGVESIHI